MKNASERFSFFKNPQFFAIVGFIIILFAIPATIYEVQKSQELRQHAQVSNHTQDTCGLVTVDVSENPVCRPYNGQPFAASSYTATFTVKSVDGKQHNVHYKAYSNFCTTGVGNSGSNHSCISANPAPSEGTKMTPFTLPFAQSPTQGFSGCGSYQVDFGIISVDGNNGCVAAQNPGDILNGPGVWGACSTGIMCTLPSNTPTPTIPTTPTNTPVPSDTPTPTPTIVVTDTPTPFPTNTPFPSSTPSPTDTPNPSASPTPTNTPGPTATSTPQVFVTNTPKPTLPATGPENNSVLLAGFAGIAIAVIGSALFFGL